MDIIYGLFNLEIETTHSSLQEVEEEKEKVKRNWAELPAYVMSLILLNLGPVYILLATQWVCSSWWKLSKQPQLFHRIHVDKAYKFLYVPCVQYYSSSIVTEELAREAIDRSCGQLVEFSMAALATDELLHYMSEKSSSLRCIRLLSCFEVSENGLIEMAEKLPQLEELGMYQCLHISTDVFKSFGRLCPRLKSCRLNYMNCLSKNRFDGIAVAIAQKMPQLRYLNLFRNRLRDDDLRAVLDGCQHLESLDLRQCFDLKFAGDLKERCRNIKVLRLPDDPTDDFEYHILGFYEIDYDTDTESDDDG